ncbi:MAG: fructose-bisphosphatase class II [Leptospirales bacterium]|jgi:fructose-1,6-bisphosphatase II
MEELGLELAGVTERAARAVMPYSGKGDKDSADELAVEAMRDALNQLDRRFHVVLGEGGKDDAPMLYSGEVLGRRKEQGPDSESYDLIVDPLECTTNFARGLPDSMSVLLAAPAGSVQAVPGTYMEQLLVPGEAAHLLDGDIGLDTPVAEALPRIAKAMGNEVSEMCVVVQDRPRHKDLIAAIRATGAGVSLIDSGSISSAFRVILGRSRRTHMLWGTFGAPEGVVLAFMAREAGSGFLGRVRPHDEATTAETRELGLENKTLRETDLVRSGGVIVLSGIHSSSLLRGVELVSRGGRRVHRVYTVLWTGDRQKLLVHEDGELTRRERFG